MAESNFYVENPANSSMHNGNKPVVGVVDFPDRLPLNRPYNYFTAEAMFNGLQQDIVECQKKGNPDKIKKGVPKIIKYTIGILISLPLILAGVKKAKSIFTKFKH